MTNTHNHDDFLSWKAFAIACFVVIAISTLVGLIALPKKEGEKPTLSFWSLLIPFAVSVSMAGGRMLETDKDYPLEDNKPDRPTGNSEDDRGSRSSDVHVHTHVILPASFDEKLAIVAKDVEEIAQRVGALDEALVRQATAKANAEAALMHMRERQARENLIAMLSDFGLDGGVLSPLFRATRICMDARLWREPAQYETRYQDTERFYVEEKIWPIIQNDRIDWGTRPDFEESNEPESDPPFSAEDLEPSIEQTPFRPFRCCSQCKYIGENCSSCAVVPFGCGTGDRSEECREFERKDDGTQGTEFQWVDAPF